MNDNGTIIDTLEGGWPVKQYFNAKAKRWYVRFSQNSPLARQLGRWRLLRSHYVWMKANDTWEIPLGYVVHHDDHDRENDTPKNLILMTESEHNRLHRELAKEIGGQTFRGRKHKPETIERMRKIAQARGNNDIWLLPKTHHTEETKQLLSDRAAGESNPAYRADLDPVAINAFFDRTRSLKQTAEHFNCSVTAVRSRLSEELYQRKASPLVGRERTYQFDDAEMAALYEEKGARFCAEKYGCSQATILYRYKQFKKERADEGEVYHAAE